MLTARQIADRRRAWIRHHGDEPRTHPVTTHRRVAATRGAGFEWMYVKHGWYAIISDAPLVPTAVATGLLAIAGSFLGAWVGSQ